MYPVLRLMTELAIATSKPRIRIDEPHVSYHRCWPWDVDFNFEMNNGRILTIYDLGRIPAAARAGLLGIMRRRKWGFAMAGASVRYRRRLRTFERFEMHTRCIGRDARFIYIEQSMWAGDEAKSNILYRSAMTNRDGIVPTQEVADALDAPDWNPVLPDWVRNWIAAEDTRPWPPVSDGVAAP